MHRFVKSMFGEPEEIDEVALRQENIELKEEIFSLEDELVELEEEVSYRINDNLEAGF